MAVALALCCPPRGYRRASAVYAYFRWADDVVDAPARDTARVREFMVRQDGIIRGAITPQQPAERALCWALADTQLGPRLQPAVERMAEALCYDAHRDANPIPATDLQRQVERIGDAFVEAIWVCSGGEGAPAAPALLLARAATATHMLRDRVEDQALGYCNLPRERFGAEVPPPGPELDAWLEERATEVGGWFEQGLAEVGAIQPTRTRRLVQLLGKRYHRVLLGLSPPRDQPS